MPAEAVDAAGVATLQLHTDDGVSLVAALTADTEPARAAVVLCHGFTAHRRDPNVIHLSVELANAGYAVLRYDARGHGDSGGLCTLGDAEVHDVAAAVRAAREVSPSVIVLGASMGAIAAVRYAATDDTLTGVVAVSCPARWRLHSPQSALGALMTRTRPGRAVVRRAMHVRVAPTWTNPEAPRDLAARLRVPFAVVHGRADKFIPAQEADLLVQRASCPHQLTVVPHMGHAFGPHALGPVVDAVNWVSATYAGVS